MATGRYKLQKDNAMNAIFYRFKQGKQFDIISSIGIEVPRGRWSDAKQEILATPFVDYKKVNVKLKEFDTFIIKDYENSKLSNELEIINSKWLKKRIEKFFVRESLDEEVNKLTFFTNFIDSYITESHNRKTRKNTPVDKGTINHYNTTLNKVKAFEEHIGRKIKLSDINLNFHSHFIHFLETIQKLNPNTIGGYIDDIRLFCGNGQNNGYDIPNDFKLKDFYSPSNSTKDPYLKEEEITAIYNTHFEQDYLDNARDWFIIGLRTGLRISDFSNLSKTDIIDGFIELKTKKTEYPVIIPLHQNVVEILAKRNGDFPRKISDQKLNVYIKKVSEIAGLTEKIDGGKMTGIIIEENGKKKKIFRKTYNLFPKYELITSHICRRTFATNLYGKIDTLTIMKITGHSTEKQFLGYIKITPKESAEKLKEYWKKLKIAE